MSELDKGTTGGFDFSGMDEMPVVSVVEEDDYRPENDAPAATAQSSEAEVKLPLVDDEDDIEVGEQLDAVSSSVSTAAPADQSITAPSPAPAAVQASSQSTSSNDADVDAHSDPVQTPDSSSDDASARAADAPPRPRAPTDTERRAYEEMQRRQQNTQGGGGGGSAIGAIVGAAAAGVGGGFKLLGNGLKGGLSKDGTRPVGPGFRERLALRDPVKAEEYYARAGETVIHNKIYRDAYEGLNRSFGSAEKSAAEYARGVEIFNDAVKTAAEGTPLKDMAAKAGTSIGDYVNAVTSGSIKDAAAAALVKGLGQEPKVVAARNGLEASSSAFKKNAESVMKHVGTLETNFPGKVNTEMRMDQMDRMVKDMTSTSPTAVDDKVKKIMDEIAEMARDIADTLRKIIEKVASVVAPRGPK